MVLLFLKVFILHQFPVTQSYWKKTVIVIVIMEISFCLKVHEGIYSKCKILNKQVCLNIWYYFLTFLSEIGQP